eukprot:4103177-Prymnesium_polylepis.1
MAVRVRANGGRRGRPCAGGGGAGAGHPRVDGSTQQCGRVARGARLPCGHRAAAAHTAAFGIGKSLGTQSCELESRYADGDAVGGEPSASAGPPREGRGPAARDPPPPAKSIRYSIGTVSVYTLYDVTYTPGGHDNRVRLYAVKPYAVDSTEYSLLLRLGIAALPVPEICGRLQRVSCDSYGPWNHRTRHRTHDRTAGTRLRDRAPFAWSRAPEGSAPRAFGRPRPRARADIRGSTRAWVTACRCLTVRCRTPIKCISRINHPFAWCGRLHKIHLPVPTLVRPLCA